VQELSAYNWKSNAGYDIVPLVYAKEESDKSKVYTESLYTFTGGLTGFKTPLDALDPIETTIGLNKVAL
jgi:hypothetical protein